MALSLGFDVLQNGDQPWKVEQAPQSSGGRGGQIVLRGLGEIDFQDYQV
jgi:translation elongation factor P/translation initiation factor 5A